MSKLGLIPRLVLGAVFCVSAISKLFSMESFELYIFSFRFLSFDLCSLLARVLTACELLLGIGLVSGIWRKAVNLLCSLMLGAFSVFLLWRLLQGDTESCHCFGELLDMNPWQSLLKNAGMCVLLALGWTSPRKDIVDLLCSHARRLRSGVCRIVAVAFVSIASFVVVFAVCPPSFYFRMHNRSVNLSEELWKPFSDEFGMSQGRSLVMFFSPLCEHCQKCARKMDTIMERHQLDSTRIHVVFMNVTDEPEAMEKLIPYFYEQASLSPFLLDTRVVPYGDFLPMTDGVMPLVCLFENAELVREYSYSTLSESAIVDFLSE